ncbi:MAG TPA: hypothetical protein VN045_15825 [Microbacteriaceae bacterium]|nr:hypothetical protein [Microbacteriaceae bacterium]
MIELRTPWRARTVPIATGLALLFVLCGASPAFADDSPPLQLTTDPPGLVHILTPGESAIWNVGVTTRAATVDALVGQLRASGSLAAASPLTTVALESCIAQWGGRDCSHGRFVVLAPTTLANLSDSAFPLTDLRRSIPRGVYIQARVSMPANVQAAMQGAELNLKFTATASGEDGKTGPGRAGHMASTGSDVFGSALLATLAVTTGVGVAAAVRRRRRSHA